MVAALLRMPAVPGPGELLSLGPNIVFQFQPDFSALYVRECYPRLFDALVCDEKPTKYIGRSLGDVAFRLAHTNMRSK